MRHHVGLLLILIIVPNSNVFACATCLCGDPTLTTMGVEKPFAGRTRASIDYLSRGETVGEPDTDEHVIEETRVTYSLSYAPNRQWMISASVPMIDKSVDRFDLSHEEASGVGDTDITARWFIGQPESIATSRLWGMHFGVRIPTSSEQKNNGVAIDFDAQPGAGATIPSVGIWLGEYHLPWFFYGSVVLQHAISDGYQSYQAGNVFLVTAHSQYALNNTVALQFNLDARWKNQDRYNEIIDEDSGGTLLMATPGIAWTPIEDVLINLSYQQPILENVQGRQEEDASLRVGVTYDF